MKAIVQNEYGSPDVFELKEVEKPEVKENEVLVRVHAAALNAGDYFSMRGSPWAVRLTLGLLKPKNHIPGWDLAGQVESVGPMVKRFQPGDEVFAAVNGSCAEYACGEEDHALRTLGCAEVPLGQRAGIPVMFDVHRQTGLRFQ